MSAFALDVTYAPFLWRSASTQMWRQGAARLNGSGLGRDQGRRASGRRKEFRRRDHSRRPILWLFSMSKAEKRRSPAPSVCRACQRISAPLVNTSRSRRTCRPCSPSSLPRRARRRIFAPLANTSRSRKPVCRPRSSVSAPCRASWRMSGSRPNSLPGRRARLAEPLVLAFEPLRWWRRTMRPLLLMLTKKACAS
jgi:hypothetical protein